MTNERFEEINARISPRKHITILILLRRKDAFREYLHEAKRLHFWYVPALYVYNIRDFSNSSQNFGKRDQGKDCCLLSCMLTGWTYQV
jgi:hypothetical protein